MYEIVTLCSMDFVTWAEYFSSFSGALNRCHFGRIHFTTCTLLPFICAVLYYGLDFKHFSFMRLYFWICTGKYGSAVIKMSV
jgi:hypothetical protein